MEEFFHVVLHSLIDTAKLIPIFFVIYLLIEFLEYKNIFAFEKSKLLKGKISPAMGSLFGSVPQCGFSIISSELYSKQKISIGALVAVFVATSDEAIPIMLANYESIPAMIALIATKIILACIIGYIIMFAYSKIFKQKTISVELAEPIGNSEHQDEHVHDEHDEHHDESENHIYACCKHDLEDQKFDWKHPVIHCLKISLFIFIFNLIFSMIVETIGEENFANFLTSSKDFQPIFAVLIGLIPNCASSVVLTELFLINGLSFGAIIAGLSVNAGLGFIVLFKENKNKKENLFIILSITILSIIFGYILHFLPIKLI